jgi:prephenate dehydrogenase
VCDVSSVKVHTVAVMNEVGIKNFVATHPMFGPYSYAKQNNSLEGLRIALCDSTLSPSDEELLTGWLSSLGLKVLKMTAEAHDKLVAETLFLTHLVGQTIKRGGFERTAVDTVSFGFLMDAVESVSHDEALFRDVYEYNPYCEEVLEKYKTAEMDVEQFLKNT